MRESPREYPESQQIVHCDDCNANYDDITVVWYGDEGFATCPECDSGIEIEAPERDYDKYDREDRY